MYDQNVIDQNALTQVFVVEAGQHLAVLEEAFLGLESKPLDPEGMRALLRSAHTLKGSASLVGLDAITGVAHALEQVLERMRDGAVSPACVPVLLEAVDAIRQITAQAANGVTAAAASYEGLRSRLLDVSRGVVATLPVTAPAPDEAPAPASPVQRTGRRTLRVDLARLDELLNLTGEMLISRGRITRLIEELPPAMGRMLLEADREHDAHYRQLQDLVFDLRMVPVYSLFRQYLRSVHDLAATCGKDAALVLEGETVQVDANVVEQLRDPLTHLLRNAIDHGLESPAVRAARGKDPQGTLTLSARQEGGTIAITLSDDGAGFSRSRILAVARARGMDVPPESAPDEEIFQLVLESGFSTADTVTDLSGRGVGMDVVRRNVRALRGSLSIESHEGAGSTVTIRVPLTLAIIDGFSVGVRDETFVLPLEAVVECLELPPGERARTASAGLVDFRERPLAYVRLGEWWKLGGVASPRESLVVVQHAGTLMGIAVDRVYGEGQTIIKSLGHLANGTRGLSGSAILGTGRVALILDLATLLKDVVASGAQLSH